jgi:hypothetical protein
MLNSRAFVDRRQRIRMVWSCSNHVRHEHRWRATARACGRIQAGLARIAAGWRIVRDWLAGLAFVFAYLAIAGAMDSRDRELTAADRGTQAQAELEESRRELELLRARIAEASSRGAHPVFYLVEADSLEAAIDKLQRAWLAVAATSHDLVPLERQHKGRKK